MSRIKYCGEGSPSTALISKNNLTLVILCIICAIKNLIISISKEAIMLTVTEKANEMISNFLKDKEDSSYVRIYLSQGG
jgi:hypothetical protein